MASIHETIVSTIRETANTVNPSGRFIYGDYIFQTQDYSNASKASDEDPRPLITLLPLDWRVPKESNSNYNSAVLNMGFFRSGDPNDEAINVEERVNQMSIIAESFFYVLENNESPIRYTIGDVSMGVERGILKGYYTGVFGSFTFSVLKDCDTQNNIDLLNQFRNRNQNGNGGN